MEPVKIAERGAIAILAVIGVVCRVHQQVLSGTDAVFSSLIADVKSSLGYHTKLITVVQRPAQMDIGTGRGYFYI